MKDKLITKIQAGIAPKLTVEQLEELRRVLTHYLQNVEITEQKAPDPQKMTGMKDCSGVFISAKRIEGCSEKSLKYYETTLQAMLGSVNKPVREIGTDDLRRLSGGLPERAWFQQGDG